MLDVDVDARSIGYAGPLTPTFDKLNNPMSAHVQAAPFENLDVLDSGFGLSVPPVTLFPCGTLDWASGAKD